MKRIVLTPILKQYARDYLAELKSLKDKPKDRLWRLKLYLHGRSLNNEELYVNVIYKMYDSIITAPPACMNTINNLFAGINGLNFSKDISLGLTASNRTVKQVKKKFYQLVVEAMGYDDVQEKIFPKYIKKMGIKSCVYCNAQYAISSKKTNSRVAYISTYTIDHHFPKSQYPHLACSFFNLYPCCSKCNQFKGNKPPIFELYVNPLDPLVDRNPFVFHLDDRSFVKYSMSGDAEDLKISLNPRVGTPITELEKYNNYFHINNLYDNYKDTVEEVIWKYRMYNKAGRKALQDAFSPILPHLEDFNRFILGNYDKDRDSLKRPLAKLVQDVAKELGIL